MLAPRSRQNPFKSLVHRDQFPATYQHCTAILIALTITAAMTAKTRAIPSWHRDSFPAKELGRWSVLASGNTTSLYCRAVSSNNLGFSVIESLNKLEPLTQESTCLVKRNYLASQMI
jgi:hypothetical protein